MQMRVRLVQMRVVAPLLLALTVLLGVWGTPAASAAGSYPVTYRFADGIAANAQDPGGSPPGANNWSCKPSSAHPRPVVLVHGLLATAQDNWYTMAPLLANHGYCVFAITYGTNSGQPYNGGMLDMETSALQMKAFVQHVLQATGARKVDLVGHSEGTVMPRYWMEFLGGARYVAHYVMLTPIWHGTEFYGAATLSQLAYEYVPGYGPQSESFWDSRCGSCPEFLTGSPFMQQLNSRGFALPGVQYTDVMTRYDETVMPYTSGYVAAPNVTNFVLQDQCPLDLTDHATVAYDAVAAQDMLNALDPMHAKPVPCVAVVPGYGTPVPPPGQ